MAVLTITNTLVYHVETLSDVEALGSDHNITADVTVWVEGDKVWYRPNSISATTSTWLAVTGYQPSGFVGTEPELFSFSSQVTIAPFNTSDLVTLATLDTNGQNMKLEAYVTGVDNAVDGNVNSAKFIQSFYRSTATVSSLTAHLSDAKNSGSGFAVDIVYSLVITLNDIILRATNNSGGSAYTGNYAVSYSIQEGGFNS